MKNRSLLITTLVLATIAALAWWNQQKPTHSQPQDPRINQGLVSANIIRDSQRITIAFDSSDSPLQFSKNAKGEWYTPSYHHTPADITKLAALTQSLNRNPILKKVSSNPERIARLGLGEMTLSFASGIGETLLTINTGKSPPSGGTYLQFGEEEPAYLCQESIYINNDPFHWADHSPIDWASSEITGLLISKARTTHSIIRNPDSAATLDRILNIIIQAQYQKVLPIDHADVATSLSSASIYTLTHQNGQNITISIGSTHPAAENEQDGSLPPAQTYARYRYSSNKEIWHQATQSVAFVFNQQLYQDLTEAVEQLNQRKEEEEEESATELQTDADESQAPVPETDDTEEQAVEEATAVDNGDSSEDPLENADATESVEEPVSDEETMEESTPNEESTTPEEAQPAIIPSNPASIPENTEETE